MLPADKASPRPSGKGQTGGSAGSARIDYPDRRTGKIPIRTDGDPSSSPDVSASEIMQSMVMNDDDIEWYAELFGKQAEKFLTKRNTPVHGFDVGLNCSHERAGHMLEGSDYRINNYGVFIAVPPAIARQIERLYPACFEREIKDDSPMHVTVLYIGELEQEMISVARDVCKDVMSTFEPFTVDMVGTDHFETPDKNVFIVKVQSPKLTELHDVMKSALATAGINVDDKFDTYNGHITLKYLPAGEFEEDIDITGSWIVDRAELWNMGSPIILHATSNKETCLGCSMGMCKKHQHNIACKKNDANENMLSLVNAIFGVKLESKDVLIEPDYVKDKKKKRKRKIKNEFNAISTGAISGYTLPLGKSNKTSKQQKKGIKLAAKAFGGGKLVK